MDAELVAPAQCAFWNDLPQPVKDETAPSLPRRRHRCRRAAREDRAILAQPAALPGVRGHGPQAEAQALGGDELELKREVRHAEIPDRTILGNVRTVNLKQRLLWLKDHVAQYCSKQAN